MPHARVFQRTKSPTQSGRARTQHWMLEFEPREGKQADPLTGWAGSGDTREQVRLAFPSLEAAKDYAERNGITITVIPPPQPVLKLQAYADNFR